MSGTLFPFSFPALISQILPKKEGDHPLTPLSLSHATRTGEIGHCLLIETES